MNDHGRIRYMRLLVFFDLPVETEKQKKQYRIFRKSLMKEGFLMIQQSVYSKLVINEAAAASAIGRLKKIRPPEGLVQVLRVTERQYEAMIYITGSCGAYDEIDTMEELLVL